MNKHVEFKFQISFTFQNPITVAWWNFKTANTFIWFVDLKSSIHGVCKNDRSTAYRSLLTF